MVEALVMQGSSDRAMECPGLEHPGKNNKELP